jgi:hypothetical protein
MILQEVEGEVGKWGRESKAIVKKYLRGIPHFGGKKVDMVNFTFN